MEDKKIIQVNWSQELHDELKKDIEKFNEDFNLEKLEQLIKDETEDIPGVSNFVLLAKPNYKAKDGTIKRGIEIDGEYYAPQNDC